MNEVILVYLLLGAFAGLAAGMLGVGGGVIMIPGMVLLLDVEQHTAQGVSLAVISLMALAGTVTHYRHQNVRIRTALLIIPAAVVFSFVGGMTADMLNASVLRDIVGGIIIIVGFFMVMKGWRTEG